MKLRGTPTPISKVASAGSSSCGTTKRWSVCPQRPTVYLWCMDARCSRGCRITTPRSYRPRPRRCVTSMSPPRPGEKHTYSILSINSAGMPSAPSAQVSVPSPESAKAADGYVPFDGEKITWHGFDRYDFILDDATGEITPFKAPAERGDELRRRRGFEGRQAPRHRRRP